MDKTASHYTAFWPAGAFPGRARANNDHKTCKKCGKSAGPVYNLWWISVQMVEKLMTTVPADAVTGRGTRARGGCCPLVVLFKLRIVVLLLAAVGGAMITGAGACRRRIGAAAGDRRPVGGGRVRAQPYVERHKTAR